MITYRPVAYQPHRYVHLDQAPPASLPASPTLPASSMDEWIKETGPRVFGFGVNMVGGFIVGSLFNLILPKWRFRREDALWALAGGAIVGLTGILVHKPKIFDSAVSVGGTFTGFGLSDLMLPEKKVSGCPSLGSSTNSRSRSSKLRKTG